MPRADPAPHPPSYQIHAAPEPNKPPFKLNVVGFPEQTVLFVAEIDVGSIDKVSTVMATDAELVVSHPSILTKYVVETFGVSPENTFVVLVKIGADGLVVGLESYQVYKAFDPAIPPFAVKSIASPSQIIV